MKIKTTVIVSVSIFLVICAGLIVDSALEHPQQAKKLLSRIVPLTSETAEPEAASPKIEDVKEPTKVAAATISQVVYPQLTSTNAEMKTATLGGLTEEIKRSKEPGDYKYQVTLTAKGAAIDNVVLSEFKAKSDTITEDTELLNLTLLSPWQDVNKRTVYSLANSRLWLAPVEAEVFGQTAFPLNKLNWQLIDTNSKDEARFEATLKEKDGDYGIKLIKTYRVQPGSYDLECSLDVENLSPFPIKLKMNVQGPGGIGREAVRQDMRKVKVSYKGEGKEIETQALELTAMPKKKKKQDTEAFLLKSDEDDSTQVWSALTNKYFAAIVRPLPDGGKIAFDKAQYNPSITENKDDHDCSYSLTSGAVTLGAAGAADAAKSYSMAVYLGPKDKKIFEKNETYKALAFFQTIDFRGCCCPTSVIAPMAFGIMWLMNTLYSLMGPLGNYGVVIIFLVFLVRLAMHPVTKKSQVSMMKMQKLGPKMKEIQAKYANNKQEMNKQVMQLYRDQGVSPVSGMLPMMLQMPIWIALWTAVYTSIDMRGASFLPFWITDLSMPDRLFRFPGFSLPFFGEYFNLLPLMMGGVMYLQQKMMPSSQQTAAQPDSQMAQQQKMMMIMMPLMFPIMLYSGPAGVNLYIMSSIGAGVIEQKVIRKHLKEKEELEAVGKVPVTAKTGGKVKKKKPKPMFKG